MSDFFQAYLNRFGRVVNSDNVKLMFQSFGYDPADVDSVRKFHKMASELTGKLFDRCLDKAQSGSTIVFLGGGNGSGKSTISGKIHADFVMDSTMVSFETSRNGIQKALAYRLKPILFFVYRSPVDAWANGVLNRVHEGGHITPASVFANVHAHVRQNFLDLCKEFGSKVLPICLDNDQQKYISLDELSKKPSLSKDEILKEIDNGNFDTGKSKIGREFGISIGNEYQSAPSNDREHSSDAFELTRVPSSGNESEFGNRSSGNFPSSEDYFREVTAFHESGSSISEKIRSAFVQKISFTEGEKKYLRIFDPVPKSSLHEVLIAEGIQRGLIQPFPPESISAIGNGYAQQLVAAHKLDFMAPSPNILQKISVFLKERHLPSEYLLRFETHQDAFRFLNLISTSELKPCLHKEIRIER